MYSRKIAFVIRDYLRFIYLREHRIWTTKKTINTKGHLEGQV